MELRTCKNNAYIIGECGVIYTTSVRQRNDSRFLLEEFKPFESKWFVIDVGTKSSDGKFDDFEITAMKVFEDGSRYKTKPLTEVSARRYYESQFHGD